MTKYEPKTKQERRVNAAVDAVKFGLYGYVNTIINDLAHAEACLQEREAEIERLNNRVVLLELNLVHWHKQVAQYASKDLMLDICNDDECCECGIELCPQKDPLHFHHDGCPSCTEYQDHLSQRES